MGIQKERLEKLLVNSNSEDIKIDLSNQGISDDEIEGLVDLLKKYNHKKIKFLNLYCNDITNKGALKLVELENVTELNLCYNRIKSDGAKALILSTKIKELDLSDNSITDDCIVFIQENSTQTILNLNKNKISEENIEKIKDKTRNNRANFISLIEDKSRSSSKMFGPSSS